MNELSANKSNLPLAVVLISYFGHYVQLNVELFQSKFYIDFLIQSNSMVLLFLHTTDQFPNDVNECVHVRQHAD